MEWIKLKKKASQAVARGHLLVQLDDVAEPRDVTHLSEGSLVSVQDARGQFLGQLLVGRQQKGLGWMLTRDRDLADDWLEVRLERAIAKRQSLFHQDGLTAFRLVNGEGDGLGGVTIDWYAGYLQLNWYAAGLYQYRERLVAACQAQLPHVQGLYETLRFQPQEGQVAIQLVAGPPAPQPLVIQENGVSYAIHLGQEWMTGLFLDQRQVRDYVLSASAGQSLLNLFSYTGGFSVAAAMGGACHTVSVDVANRSLAKTQENFALNGLSAPSDTHEIRVMDVFDYIRYARRHDLTFDWVVCDPPSFARTKKVTFSALKDYGALAQDLWPLVAPGGRLVLSTNHAGYAVDRFQADCLQACPDGQLEAQFALGADYPTSPDASSAYLKVLVVVKPN